MKFLAVSVSLMKEAWPPRYEVSINKLATVSYSAEDSVGFLCNDIAYAWSASSFQLWKMFVIEADFEKPRIEFRRIEWGGPSVKNLRADGTRVTVAWAPVTRDD